MSARSGLRRAVAVGALLSGLAVGTGPVLAASADPAPASRVGRAAAGGSPATLRLRTVPTLKGVRVTLDGRTYRTNARGRLTIQTRSGPHHVHIAPPRSRSAGTTVRFARWLDGIALASRRINLSPGVNHEQAGFVVSHPVTIHFTDTHGHPVPTADVARVTIVSSLGQRYTFQPSQPSKALAVNRVVRDPAGLQSLLIRYSVHEAVIDTSNVVYGGSQDFYVQPPRIWTVQVLLFPLRIEVRDALFHFPVGSAVQLTMPDGANRRVRLGPGHAVTLSGLPRATYQLLAKGQGFGLSAPCTLSKPQVAKVLLFSWIDIAAVMAFVVLFLIGLPVVGGRVIRRQHGARLPVWHADPAEDSEAATVVLTKLSVNGHPKTPQEDSSTQRAEE